MKTKNNFLSIILFSLAFSSLAACESVNKTKGNTPIIEEEEEKILEIGDTVIEWSSKKDLNAPPINLPASSPLGDGEIVTDFGRNDSQSIKFDVEVDSFNKAFLTSECLYEPFITDNDVKNGDIISAYVYAVNDSNIATFQIQAVTSNGNEISGEVIQIDETNSEEWIRLVISYDTLDTLSSIRINYTAVDQYQKVSFYLDDIKIVLGEETVKTKYVSNDESLSKSFEEYFKVGTCMSSSMLRNTTIRKIAVENFNSITAENEGKPDSVLDQAACQELASNGDESGVVIKTSPFEKMYDWCEAKHIGVRHHTFVWFDQTPSWFFNVGYQSSGKQVSRSVMLKRMENFIRVSFETINERWPGLVYAIDVANEAVQNGGVRNSNNNWYSTIGEDFVYYAFKYADMYRDPEQELYYNDFAYDYNTSHCEFALNTLLKKAINEGIIDGVGIQSHIDSDQNMETLMTDAKMIYEKGLKCQLTELDITVSGTDEASLNKQKAAYKLLTKKILENNANNETDINAFIVWGITDNASWKSYQNPLLFDSSYAKKPAYYGMLEALEEFESGSIVEN